MPACLGLSISLFVETLNVGMTSSIIREEEREEYWESHWEVSFVQALIEYPNYPIGNPPMHASLT